MRHALRHFLIPMLVASGCTKSPSSDDGSAAPPTAEPAPRPPAPEAVEPVGPEVVREVVDGLDAFATDVYARVARKPGDSVISPASIALALSMLEAGARGATADEIATALHQSGDDDQTRRAVAGLLRDWNEPHEAYLLAVADRLFADRHLELRADYVEITRRYFGAPLEALDFRGDAGGSRQRINGWVADQTHDRIRDLLPPPAVTPATRLVLVNAVYFKARWVHPFNEAATQDAPFHAASGELTVPTMFQVETLEYAAVAEDELALLELPYEGGAFAMTILLPNARDGLPALEHRLDAEHLKRWVTALALRRVEVRVPRFRIDPAEPLLLSGILRELGIVSAFDPTRADFSGIAPPDAKLALDEGYHRGFIEVDEKGTEAAAATALVMREGAALPSEPPAKFSADHPFVYLVRDVRSGAILFMGRVAAPRTGK